MSKFTRVSEEIPDRIMKTFGLAEPEIENDSFASLKATAEQRRAAIMREVIRSNDNSKKKTIEAQIDWQGANEPAKYNGYDSSDNIDPSKAIKRASYGADHGDNMRPRTVASSSVEGAIGQAAPYIYGTEAEQFLHEASIWNPDVLALKDSAEQFLTESMKESDSKVRMATRQEQINASKQAKNNNWEQQQMERLSGSKILSASGRVNPLLSQVTPLMCTSIENVSASPFGLPNIERAIERDQRRAEVAKRVMNERKAIKRPGADRDDKNAEWESSVSYGANTYQNHHADWLDSYLDNI